MKRHLKQKPSSRSIKKATGHSPVFEKLEERQLFSVFTVTSPLGTGPNTLQAAVNATNHDTSGASDTITFNLNNHSAQQQTIVLSTPLNITHP